MSYFSGCNSGTQTWFCSVADTHNQRFYADILVDIFPMQASAASTDYVVFTLARSRAQQPWEISKRHTKFSGVG
jgi:hypothetical protein